MAAEVWPAASSGRRGRFSPHLTSCLQLLVALGSHRQRPILQNPCLCSWQELKLPGLSQMMDDPFVECDFSRNARSLSLEEGRSLLTGKPNWEHGQIKSRGRPSKGPDVISSESSEDSCSLTHWLQFTLQWAETVVVPMRISFFQCGVTPQWNGKGLAKCCECSWSLVRSPQKLQDEWKVAEMAVNTQWAWKSRREKWSIFAPSIFASQWVLFILYTPPSILFPLGHILMWLPCIKHGTETTDSLGSQEVVRGCSMLSLLRSTVRWSRGLDKVMLAFHQRTSDTMDGWGLMY